MKNDCDGLAQALAGRSSVECLVVAKDGTLHLATRKRFRKPKDKLGPKR